MGCVASGVILVVRGSRKSHWAESTNLVPFKSWRATMRAQRDTYACRHRTGVGSSSVRSLASKFFNGGSTWLATWPWQCEEALKSHVFWRGRSGARRGAPAPKELRDPLLFRALLHARSMRSVLTGSKRHHGESRNRVVGAAIKASGVCIDSQAAYLWSTRRSLERSALLYPFFMIISSLGKSKVVLSHIIYACLCGP